MDVTMALSITADVVASKYRYSQYFDKYQKRRKER
jgi:hypothetical protein